MENFAQKAIQWVGSTSSLVVHTILFVGVLSLRFLGLASSDVMLVLTTAVSLEAIYLAILNQMTLNAHTKSIETIHEDVEAVQKELDDEEEMNIEFDDGIAEVKED